ncbi:MAG: type IV pilus assembly protein PilM [Candidatus Nealsonbacteria bacterium DGGOD1a]|nr:MAG: type IV pilus assembly protein PilM [Candidatus Nealsonbacteria bacterium DGGOD1a]
MLPKLFAKKFLGIDIGTSSIRLVELEKSGQVFGLSNYGQIDIDQIESDIPKLSKRAVSVFSTGEIAEMIQAVSAAAKIHTRQCAFSIPDFSTFFTAFCLPPMTKKELPEAVMYEARQHIPLPVESVNIDWQLVGGVPGSSEKLEVTVAAIPNEIIAQYREIAAKAKLEVVLMEAEMFGLAQALVPKKEERCVCLIDIGSQSTVCSLVEKQILRYSHSFDRGSGYLTDELVRRLPVNHEVAIRIKENYGLKMISMIEPGIRERVKADFRDALLPIFREIETMFGSYRRFSNSEVVKIILSGGIGANMEIKDIFADYFKKEVEIADPFKNIDHSAAIEKNLKSIGPVYAVAAGMAQRGLEFSKRRKK